VLLQDLFGFLFNDSDREDDNFQLLLSDLERLLVDEHQEGGHVTRRIQPGTPTTFAALFEAFRDALDAESNGEIVDPTMQRLFGGHHHQGTLRRFYRRLRRVVSESGGMFRTDLPTGMPLDLQQAIPGRPWVVDLFALEDHHLQRFCVAALMQQAKRLQMRAGAGNRMHYVFVLDELNRFAPRGHSDPITQLVEEVAAELRSRGVILFGAQQQASLVSQRVIENAAIRVIGRSGGRELEQSSVSFLPDELRDFAERMGPGDKIVYEPSFREPMMITVPRVPWAMRRQEAERNPPPFMAERGSKALEPAMRQLALEPDEIPF
jgi:DNA helicase HerA-like ATPase